MPLNPSPRAARIFAISWVLLILGATMTPVAGDVPTPGPWCIRCGDLGTQDFVLNVVLFVPLGISLAFLSGPTMLKAAVPPLFTLMIELLQWSAIPGRDAAVGDLIANTAGGWLGLAAGLAIAGRPLRAQLKLGSIGLGALLSIMLLFTAWALLPSGRSRVFTYLQLAPVRPGYSKFDGTVSVTINGTRMEHWASMNTDDYPGLAHGLFRGTAHISRSEGAALRRSLVLRLARSVGPMEAELSQDGADLIFRSSRNGAELGFRTPSFRVSDVFSRTSQQLDVAFAADSAASHLTVVSAGSALPSTPALSFPVTLARGWEVFSPWAYLPFGITEALRLAWIPIAWGLVMFLAAAAWSGWLAPVVVSAAAILLTTLMPRLAGIASATSDELLPLVAALLVSLLLGRTAQRRVPTHD